MPFFAPPVTTETDAQLSFLEQQCQQLRLTAAGLTDEQARSTPTVSSLSIAGRSATRRLSPPRRTTPRSVRNSGS